MSSTTFLLMVTPDEFWKRNSGLVAASMLDLDGQMVSSELSVIG